jgi:hypothetical protein
LSAGIFGPDGDVEVVYLTETKEQFQALADGEIDALSGAPLSLNSDVLERTTKQGYAFSQPFFYGAE